MDCLEKLVGFYKSRKEEFKTIPCELLYGCSGYLYSLLFVNAHVEGVVSIDIIKEVGVAIIFRIL